MSLLIQSEIIVQHGQRVMNVIDRVMANIDYKEKIWDLLIEIGREHFSEYYIACSIKYSFMV